MSDDVTEYRFKTLGAHGHVVLSESDVTCDTTSYLGRWKTTTPYSAIEPHPISLWQTPPITIYCGVGLGFLAVVLGFAAFGEVRSNAWSPTSVFAFYAVFSVTTFVLLIRVVRNWSTEWIMFPTAIDGHRIAYIKTSRDKDAFDAFTINLKSRIMNASRRQKSGEPDDTVPRVKLRRLVLRLFRLHTTLHY